MSSSIVIYTKNYCPYCKAAKALLTERGVKFTDFEISDASTKRKEMIQRAGGRSTVPQIFIGGFHVGGFTDLAELDRSGGLDALLRPHKAG
ncbi:glutaredoxin 3 [Epibacterium sp. DP7N7-1]|nr:glutaredoxin 3 [Epibacterium sp. DP7N7-1]